MFALILAAAAALSTAPGEPARNATIINGDDLRDAKLSMDDLPLKFPEGTATMALGVSAKGKLTSCAMKQWEVGGPVDPKIEALICDTLRRKAKFDPALDAAGQPVDSLYTVGADPVLPEEPELPSLNGLFSANDYPMAALRASVSGATSVRLEVGPDGRASACQVISSSGNSALDARTCEVFTSRGRFKPGRGPDGQPIAGHLINRVRWQLPDAQPLTDSAQKISVTFDADGKMNGCESYWGEGKAQTEACSLLNSVAGNSLTPIQRAFRTLTKEEGILVGPAQAAALVGSHKGENRLAMVAVFFRVNDNGSVISCDPVAPTSEQDATSQCRSIRRTKFALGEDAAPGQRTGVSYKALILRRPGS